MGVPGLFPYVSNKFGKHVHSFQAGSRDDNYGKMDYVHVDGNAMVHPAAQEAYNYGERAIKGYDPYSSMTYLQKRTLTFNIFWRKILTILEWFQPKVLDITLDGPAPLAKQNQQRTRRFQALADGVAEGQFKNGEISPGTVFMLEFVKFLHLKIRELISRRPSLKVVFSSVQVPGEGEHKIIDYIRQLSEKERGKKHLIVGEDADLIFLTLATKIPQMFLLRADQKVVDLYFLLAISEIAKALPLDFGVTDRTPETISEAINDFIFTGFFVGNDFLPMIKMFVSLRGGFSQMMDIIVQDQLRLTHKGKVNIIDFKKFTRSLAMREPADLLESHRDFPRFLEQDPEANKIFKDHTLAKFISKEGLNYDGYREAYLKKANVPNKAKPIKVWCHSYLKTLVWVLIYYTQGLPSWEWYYPYHYAPLMTDFADYIESLDKKDITDLYSFDKGTPSKPFVQLLCILPPAGSLYLPPAYRHLMESPQSVLVEQGYYPLPPYEVDFEGKRRDHEGVVDINMVEDISLVRKVYEQVAKRDPNYYARNSKGKNYVFSHDKAMETHVYKSDYGSIRECQVRMDRV